MVKGYKKVWKKFFPKLILLKLTPSHSPEGEAPTIPLAIKKDLIMLTYGLTSTFSRTFKKVVARPPPSNTKLFYDRYISRPNHLLRKCFVS